MGNPLSHEMPVASQVKGEPLDPRSLGLPPLWLLVAWFALLLSVWPVVQQASFRSRAIPKYDLLASADFYRQHRYAEAVEAARRYLQLQPNSAEALTNLGISYAALGKWDDAIDATRHALLIKPSDQLEWNNLRFILARKLALHPTPESYQNSALEAYTAGRFLECVEQAKKALALYPKYTKAFNLLSVCYLNLGMYDDAIQKAREALRIEPEFHLAANNLHLAEQVKARGTPSATLSSTTPTADGLVNLSLAKYRTGDKQGCIDDAHAALRINPGLAIAWNNIAACSNDLGQPDQAIAAATEALRLQPDFQLARNNLSIATALKARQENAGRAK